MTEPGPVSASLESFLAGDEVTVERADAWLVELAHHVPDPAGPDLGALAPRRWSRRGWGRCGRALRHLRRRGRSWRGGAPPRRASMRQIRLQRSSKA